MSKTIIIALLVVTMIGGGAVFAEYSSEGGFLNLSSDPDESEILISEDENPENYENNGDTTNGDDNENGTDSDNDNNGENELNEEDPNGDNEEEADNDLEENGDERSEVAKAVHKALSGSEDITPGDGNEFGQAVSERARDGEINLGKEVSKAAREANGSLDVDADNGEEADNGEVNGNENVKSNGNGINTGNSLFNNNGNSGNAGSNGSPGNSGNRGNSGNAGGGKPGN